MSHQIIDEEQDLVVFSAARENKFALNNTYKPVKKPTKVQINAWMTQIRWCAPWGEFDNLFPKMVYDALQGCAPAQICIELLSTICYGNGVRVYELDTVGNVKPVIDVDQFQWFRQTRINKYLMNALVDYFQLGNQFPQLIRNQNKANPGFGAIVNISAPYNRIGIYNNDLGRSESVYIYGTWQYFPSQAMCEEVELINEFDGADQAKKSKSSKFMMRVGNYTPGNIYYDDMPWHALLRTGTLDVFPEIPKIRKNRIKNAMFIKYHVRIHEYYWYLKHGGIEKGRQVWESKTTAQRSMERAELYRQIDDKLSGSDNAFKSLFTASYTDVRTGTVQNLITIEKIETEVGEKSAFDPDKMSNVADIFLGFGVPAAVGNTVLSDNKSRGGGSDIREGQMLMLTRMPMHRDNILYPVEFAMRNTFNKAGKPLLADNQFLGFENTILTTLDASETGINTQNIAQPQTDK